MYYYGNQNPVQNVDVFSLANVGIWVVISAVIAIMGGLVIYFCFLTKENEDKLTGKEKWLYDFLSFKKLYAESIIKIIYIMTAIFITLSSFALLSSSFLGFICMLIFGNVIARITYEFLLIFLLICKNTKEINDKLKDKKIDNKKDTKNEEK